MWQKRLTHKIKSWWNYQRIAQGKYYLHSPFVFWFYTEVLEPSPDAVCVAIENELLSLKSNHTPIRIHETFSTVSQLAKREIEVKYGKAIYQLLKESSAKYVLDLGPSLGIGTAYWASAKPTMEVTTIDESLDLQQQAKTVHGHLGLKNITYINLPVDSVLEKKLADFPRLDVVILRNPARFFQPLLPYIHAETILIIDDIHETEEAEHFWNEVKAHPSVTLTIDLYRIGLVFFRKENLAKTDFVLKY